MDGVIHNHLIGQKIAGCYKDGQHLILAAEDGHQYKIGWFDAGGKLLDGEPVLVNLGCKIVLPVSPFDGVPGQL